MNSAKLLISLDLFYTVIIDIERCKFCIKYYKGTTVVLLYVVCFHCIYLLGLPFLSMVCFVVDSCMSQSSTSWTGDIGSRYERLAAEYNKLRAQASVLKKGILDERAKTERLENELKTSESTVRRLKNENESLEFRNEQLLKRVHNVQEELEEAQRKGGTKSKKNDKNTSGRDRQLETSIAILEEELKNKLTQNERLTTTVHELEGIKETLSLELKELKEKIMNGGSVKGDEGPSLSVSTSSITVNSINGLSDDVTLPSLASPSHSPLWTVAESARAVLSGLSMLFSLMEQRSRLYPYDASLERLPAHVDKLSNELGELSKRLTSTVEDVDRIFNEPSEKWKSSCVAVLPSLQQIFSSAYESLPSQLTSMSSEESKCDWSNAALESLNDRWRNSICVLLRESTILPSIVRESMEGDMDALNRLCELSSTLYTAIKGVQEAFSARWLIETRLPVQTKKGKCVGTATRDCLLKMVAEASKASLKLKSTVVEMEGEEKMREERREREEALNTPLPSCHSSTSLPVEEPSKDDSESSKKASPVPESANNCQSRREDSKWRLSQMETLREKLRSVEQEKEKLSLDLYLLNRKLDMLSGHSREELHHDIGEETESFYVKRLENTAEELLREKARGDYYNKECAILVRSTKCVMKEKNRLMEEMEMLRRAKAALADELRITRSGYESQLREMSEHMVDVHSAREERERDKAMNPNNKNTVTPFYFPDQASSFS